MARAGDVLGAGKVSTASDRLAAKGDAKGHNGDAATTIKLRNEFARVAADTDLQFEDWVETQGYAIGDNGQVYKKD